MWPCGWAKCGVACHGAQELRAVLERAVFQTGTEQLNADVDAAAVWFAKQASGAATGRARRVCRGC